MQDVKEADYGKVKYQRRVLGGVMEAKWKMSGTWLENSCLSGRA